MADKNFLTLRPVDSTPEATDEISEPWDIATGHANTQEDMGSPSGLGTMPTRHDTHVANHSIATYASYVDEDVRNPEGAS